MKKSRQETHKHNRRLNPTFVFTWSVVVLKNKPTNQQTNIYTHPECPATLVYTAISQQVNLVPDLCPFRSLTTV